MIANHSAASSLRLPAALAYHYLRSFPLQGRVEVGESACDMILHRGNRNPELFPNLSVSKLVNTLKQKYFSRAIGQLGQGAAISSHHVLSFDTVMLIGRDSRFASFADRHMKRCQSRLRALAAVVKQIAGDALQ